MPTPSPQAVTAAPTTLTAFAGFSRIAAGARGRVIAALRDQAPAQHNTSPLIRVFVDRSGERIDLDLRANAPQEAEPDTAEIKEPQLPAVRGVGRPRLGVVAREITLLPRHWDWLATQPGGASVALRKLVEEARRASEGRDAVRSAREATYRFISEIGGDLAGFEEASRALFAGDRQRFEAETRDWPEDVRQYAGQLASAAWSEA